LPDQVNDKLAFRFNEERTFDPEELEIARALATQASLAIQLTRLAKSSRQSAVLEERNRLAAEIHDPWTQLPMQPPRRSGGASFKAQNIPSAPKPILCL
jgi:GAF domain-containing protein